MLKSLGSLVCPKVLLRHERAWLTALGQAPAVAGDPALEPPADAMLAPWLIQCCVLADALHEEFPQTSAQAGQPNSAHCFKHKNANVRTGAKVAKFAADSI